MCCLNMKALKYFQWSTILELNGLFLKLELYVYPTSRKTKIKKPGVPWMLPLLVEPEDLEKELGNQDILIIDLCKPDIYAQGHLPGAVHLDYSKIISGQRPAPGMVPDIDQLAATLSALGLGNGRPVVAYDDEGGGRACRFLWTLDYLGHSQASLLNGGLHAWTGESRPLVGEPSPVPKPSDFEVKINMDVFADKNYVLSKLGDANVRLLDARSLEEYNGLNVMAARGGHIPGAVNLEWLSAIDKDNNLRMHAVEKLESMLGELGFNPEQEVITYCQTHHRSSHSYIMLKNLGYKKIRGYAGSWSEWGNSKDTPIE